MGDITPTFTKKVSVMMACYNAEAYVKRAIESILNQTYTNFELIIVDDGSTDNSKMIISQYVSRDSRVKYFRNEKNEGLVYTRNRMLDISSGEYLAVMDADDVSLPERLEVEVEFLEKHLEIDGVSSAAWKIDEEDNILGKALLSGRTANEVKAWFFFDDVILHSSAMFRKSIVEKNKLRYESDYVIMQDYAFFSNYLVCGNWIVLDTPLVSYRILQSSISHNIDANRKMLAKKLERKIKEGYLEAFEIKANQRDLDKVIDSTSKFKQKKSIKEKIQLIFPYFRLVYAARNTVFYKEFAVCAAKMWKRI